MFGKTLWRRVNRATPKRATRCSSTPPCLCDENPKPLMPLRGCWWPLAMFVPIGSRISGWRFPGRSRRKPNACGRAPFSTVRHEAKSLDKWAERPIGKSTKRVDASLSNSNYFLGCGSSQLNRYHWVFVRLFPLGRRMPLVRLFGLPSVTPAAAPIPLPVVRNNPFGFSPARPSLEDSMAGDSPGGDSMGSGSVALMPIITELALVAEPWLTSEFPPVLAESAQFPPPRIESRQPIQPTGTQLGVGNDQQPLERQPLMAWAPVGDAH
jgi:hypothetical protein